MSSYSRPSQRQPYNWREREAEAKRKAAEEEQRRRNVMNESNFPTLSAAKPTPVVTGNKYAELAQQWSVDATVDKRMEEYKKFSEAAERRETERIMSHRSHRTRYERHEDEYDEDIGDEPVCRSVLDSDSGWNEVKRKSYKGKRELTVEEMDAMEDAIRAQENATEFNAHLFESNRHDHDKV